MSDPVFAIGAQLGISGDFADGAGSFRATAQVIGFSHRTGVYTYTPRGNSDKSVSIARGGKTVGVRIVGQLLTSANPGWDNLGVVSASVTVALSDAVTRTVVGTILITSIDTDVSTISEGNRGNVPIRFGGIFSAWPTTTWS